MKKVELAEYSIFFGNVEEALSGYLHNREYSSISVIVDTNTRTHCWPRISGLIPHSHLIEIPSGEIHKNIETSRFIWQKLIEFQVDRKGLVINLGGGVIGDMGGFCAACYMRGIDFIQIPTTLLSQVDASIGGKLAIDLGKIKNIVGAFINPKAVLVDTTFYRTLPPAEFRSGYAEVIKHAVISDTNIWDRLKSPHHWRKQDWQKEVFESVLIKREIVEQDPFEYGLRKVLNFGHTIGHSLESFYLEKERSLLHGEAIALGMIGESYLSHKLTGLKREELLEMVKYLVSVYPDLGDFKCTDQGAIIDLMKNDKKNVNKTFRFSLLERIGVCTFDVEVGEEDIQNALEFINSAFNSRITI